MFFPEFLYRLSSRDQQVTWLDPRFDSLTASAAGLTVEVDFTVPSDRPLILTSANIVATPGAGQAVIAMLLRSLAQGDSSPVNLAAREIEVAVAGSRFLNWTGEVILPPAWSLRARASFSAAVNPNDVELHLAGILIPVGNIQRV